MRSIPFPTLFRISLCLCLLGLAGCTQVTSTPASTLPPNEGITSTAQPSESPVIIPTQLPTEPPLSPTDTPESPTSEPVQGTSLPDTGAPPSLWNEIPILSDATEPIEDGNTYSYATASSIAVVQDYYEQTMPKLGWELLSSGEGETVSQMMIFQKGDQNATIALAQHPVEADHTLVVIVLQ
jgi:hypothetical protein